MVLTGSLGSANGRPERSDDVDRVVRAEPGEPLGAGAVGREDDLDGAAVDPALLHAVDRERAPQQRRAARAADGERHEVPGAGLLGDAGRHEGEGVVVPDAAHRQHLAPDLDRRHQLSSRHARRSRPYSWRERTPISPAISASMPWTAAARPWTVVMHGTPRVTAAVRIS